MSKSEFVRGAKERKSALKEDHDKQDAQQIKDQYKNDSEKSVEINGKEQSHTSEPANISYTELIAKKMKEHSKKRGN